MNIELFDFSVNVLESIIWQYENAPNIVSLITQKQTWYNTNQTQFWTNWYNNVFNLAGDQMNLFGIAIWSIILDVPLYVPITPEPNNKPIFGFNEIVGSWPTLLNSYLNFGNSNFSTRGQSIILSLEEQRFLLRLKYFDLTTRGDIKDINSFLAYLVSTSTINYTGTIYALDGFNMTMTYVFTKEFPYQLLRALQELDILPRPAGVGIRYYINYGKSWGFNQIVGSLPNLENSNLNFGNGNFATGLI
jgi:hypothetical protein